MKRAFQGFKDEIEEGDLVMAYLSRDSVIPLSVERGKVIHNRFGSYHHDDMIGTIYGTQMSSRSTSGFIFLLHPTPELWTAALPHRTQILYAPDISFITSKLRIRPGQRVIEAGTGSGSFSHSLFRTVGASGKVYTYEFHEKRCETARLEFKDHGLMTEGNDSIVVLTHRNVCVNGFGLDDTLFKADAVFLDLPAPWEAIRFLEDHLSAVTRICCFCMIIHGSCSPH